MAEYLPAPPRASVPQGDHVSLSPPRRARSGGTIRSFTPAAQPSVSVPLRSEHSVGGHSQLDPEPQGHVSQRSGRSKPSSAYGGRPRSLGGLSLSSIPSSVGFGRQHAGDASISVASPSSLGSPTHSKIFFWGCLIPLTPCKVPARILHSGGAAHLSPLGQLTTFPLLLGVPLLPPPRLW